MTNRIDAAEEQIAHLSRAVEDLSDILVRHASEIGRLQRQIEVLIRREQDREPDQGAGPPLADQRPPHW